MMKDKVELYMENIINQYNYYQDFCNCTIGKEYIIFDSLIKEEYIEINEGIGSYIIEKIKDAFKLIREAIIAFFRKMIDLISEVFGALFGKLADKYEEWKQKQIKNESVEIINENSKVVLTKDIIKDVLQNWKNLGESGQFPIDYIFSIDQIRGVNQTFHYLDQAIEGVLFRVAEIRKNTARKYSKQELLELAEKSGKLLNKIRIISEDGEFIPAAQSIKNKDKISKYMEKITSNNIMNYVDDFYQTQTIENDIKSKIKERCEKAKKFLDKMEKEAIQNQNQYNEDGGNNWEGIRYNTNQCINIIEDFEKDCESTIIYMISYNTHLLARLMFNRYNV